MANEARREDDHKEIMRFSYAMLVRILPELYQHVQLVRDSPPMYVDLCIADLTPVYDKAVKALNDFRQDVNGFVFREEYDADGF